MASQDTKEDYEPVLKKIKDDTNGESSHSEGPSTSIKRREPFDKTHKITRNGGKYHLLLGVTGSVAVIKLQELIETLYKMTKEGQLWIKIVATDNAMKFIEKANLQLADVIYEDRDEWSMWSGRGDPVLHIELRKWADGMLIAPLDANSMAKIANGICDNLLTSLVRAWDPKKPLHFAPAMNSFMWDSTLTFQHRTTLRDLLRFKEIPPIEKDLMCGDHGMGAMATIQMWIFGYGSLLWYTDFPYEKVQGGHVGGFVRRFWQLSPDHRGTPDAPGRTVTLIPAPTEACWGLAYKVPEEHQKATIEYLDHREKAGYTCEQTWFRPDDGSPPFPVHVYISTGEDNEFHAGPTEDEEIASTILIRHGPSGPNVEYALKLALVLRSHSPHSDDAHVYSIERRILELAEKTGQGKESLEKLGYRLVEGKYAPPQSNNFSLLKRS